MKKQSFLFLFIIIAVVLTVLGNRFSFLPERTHAQITPPATEESQLDQKVETFFRNLGQAGTQTAAAAVFEELFREGLSAARTTTEAVGAMSKSFTDLSSSDVGRLQSNEKIDSKQIGKDVILLRYLTKHDNAPVAWWFTFYRSPSPRTGSGTSTTMSPMTSGSPWNLILVRFDTNLESLM